MKEFESNFENVSIELKRGLTNLVVLSQCKEPTYGYELVKLLDEKNFPLDANTVYPLLRRLEKQGLLRSDWDVTTDKPRKYYLISEIGEVFFERLKAQWYEMIEIVKNVIEE
jgi:DNA-binding PadR family transcriptional regulator